MSGDSLSGDRAAGVISTAAAGPGLHDLRAAIEAIDAQFIALIAERRRLARAVGQSKRSAALPALDPAQEAAVVRRAANQASAHGIDAEIVRDIFWQLIGLCRRAQMEES